MRYEITKSYIFVDIPYARNASAKTIGAIEFNSSRKMWKFHNNIWVMRELMKHFPELMKEEHFVTYGKGIKAEMDALLYIKAQEDHPGDPRLRPYQRVDVAYLSCLMAAGIFNEPRTGKTPTILKVIEYLKTMRNLVICPASLQLNWKKEIEMWTDLKPFIAKGTPKQRMKIYEAYIQSADAGVASVLIVSKDTIKVRMRKNKETGKQEHASNDSAWFLSKHFDVTVVDEAHFLRKRDSSQSKAIYALKTHRRYAMTGTPTVKNGTDIYGILSWLQPDHYTNYWNFVNRYFTVFETYTGGTEIGKQKPATEKELKELVGFISIQRKRKDKGVMDWLPDKTRIEIPIEMESKQRKHYREMRDTFYTVDEEGKEVDSASVLAQLTRLRQLCLDPSLLGLDAPSAKTDALLEYLEDNQQPVVIMSMFTGYLRKLHALLSDKGYKVGTLHGEMSSIAKDQAKADFQTGKIDILLCNIIAAGVGHTLDRAENVIFMDKAWNPADNEQAEDRIVPVTEARNHPINVITFPVMDSVDERMDQLLAMKTDLTNVINTGAREAIMQLIKRLA